MSPKVAIIILNWNGWKDTLECLGSILKIRNVNYCIIIVDNRSSDNSLKVINNYIEGLEQPISNIKYLASQTLSYRMEGTDSIYYYSSCTNNGHIYIISNKKNFGFAKGNNMAIQLCHALIKPEHILLLNNDTVVEENFLEKLIEIADNNVNIGVVGPLIYYYDYFGSKDIIWFAGGKIDAKKFPCWNHIGMGRHFSARERSLILDCDWISGAAMMITKNSPVKYLDESFFFGGEDIDYSITLKKYGFKVVLVPASKIWHKVGVSRRKLVKNKPLEIVTYLKLDFKLLVKHRLYAPWYAPAYAIQIIRGLLESSIRLINRK